jgi:DNA polymerase III sliding clamp (beta) subunit (PCNA family)
MSFKATVTDPRIFRMVLDAAGAIISEGDWLLSKDGISLRSMDTQRAAMVDLTIGSSFFSDYQAKKSQQISINLDDLRKRLSKVGSQDTLSLELLPNTNQLKIEIHGRGTTTYTMQLRVPGEERISDPALDLDIAIKLVPDFLREVVGKIGLFPESSIQIQATQDGKLTFQSKYDENEAVIEVDKADESSILEFQISEEEGSSPYSLEYLKKMVKLDADTLELAFASGKPLRVIYGIGDAIKLQYLLAPYEAYDEDEDFDEDFDEDLDED